MTRKWPEDYIGAGIVLAAALIVANMAGCDVAQAGEIPNNLAVQAILGESLHDSESMGNMAHALFNRGTLIGVYGLKSAQGKVFAPKLYTMAQKAWNKAKNGTSSDNTKGATHWLSDYDLSHSKPRLIKFRFNMRKTLYQGEIHYYKET